MGPRSSAGGVKAVEIGDLGLREAPWRLLKGGFGMWWWVGLGVGGVSGCSIHSLTGDGTR